MEKLSRMEKYKELRMEIDSDAAAAAGKPSINSVELQKQLRSLNEPQDDEGSSRHSRQTERFSKEIDLQLKEETDEGTDQFHNEYLDDFINEVKEYNLEKGNCMSGNTQIDILLQLNKGKDRIQSMPPKQSAAQPAEEEDEGVSYTQSLSSEELQEEVDRLFAEDEQENEASAHVEIINDDAPQQPEKKPQESFVFDSTPLVRINPIMPKEGETPAEEETAPQADEQATLNVPLEILKGDQSSPAEAEQTRANEAATKPAKEAKEKAKREQKPEKKEAPKPVENKEKTKTAKESVTQEKKPQKKKKKEKTPSSTSNKVLNVILLILILALIAVIAVTIYWLQQAGGF